MLEITGKNVDRRSFLRGSALFAAALGMSVVPSVAGAQQQPQQQPKKEEEKPAEPFTEEKKDGVLVDAEGREYRVCPQCAYNMYKQGRMWFCENCGYSYVE
ncbi:MAG: twin-arginine translocation signal domain-containing protein [Vicinamibacteria bacterium]